MGGQLVLEDRQAGLQRLAEALFLTGEHTGEEVAVLEHIGIGVAHHIDRGVDQRRHHQLLGAEQVRITHRAADDAAQHISTVLVAGEHTVVDEHRGGPGMLGEHAHAEADTVVVIARRVGLARERARLVDQRLHEVGLPHRIDALQQAQHPLETKAGVDRRLGQQRATAIRRLVVLHEHEVPELHEPVALRVMQRPALGAERRATVDVDLAARATGAGVTHLPEVVLVAEALNAAHRHTDLLVPDRLGLVVALVHGDPQPVAVEAEHLGRQLPAPRDDLVLEVVAEAEVAQHLEEHEVTLGAADVVEVVVLATGSGALLRTDRSLERRHLIANEVGLERNHAGHGEQHGRIVRDQTRRWHGSMAALCEEVDEGRTELIGVGRHGTHGATSLPS